MNRKPRFLVPAMLLATLLQGLPVAAASVFESPAKTYSGLNDLRRQSKVMAKADSPGLPAEYGAHGAIAVITSTTDTPPTADFTCIVLELDVSCTDRSRDPNGTIVTWNWNFGDGSTSGDTNPSHSYEIPGTYSITLTVIDNGGNEEATSRDITVGAD